MRLLFFLIPILTPEVQRRDGEKVKDMKGRLLLAPFHSNDLDSGNMPKPIVPGLSVMPYGMESTVLNLSEDVYESWRFCLIAGGLKGYPEQYLCINFSENPENI